MLLLEIYEEVYGIHKHDDPQQPLSLIAHHFTEDYKEISLEYKILYDFSQYKIGKHFNISLVEYLSLPCHMQENMIDIVIKQHSKELEVEEELSLEYLQTKKK